MKKVLKEILPPKAYYYLKRKMTKQFDERYIIYDFLDYNDGVMFDVGVMDGSSFMPFLLRGWDVYAFEPDEKNHNNVSEYLGKWNLKTNLIKQAVSDVEETKMFYTSTASAGIPSLLKFNENQVASHKVSTIKLSNFVQEHNIDKIDFLKIDVEGYDLMALKGFDFSVFKPRVIMSEFEDKKTELLGYSTKDMAEFLIDKGYYLIYSIWHPIQEYGIQHDFKKMSTDMKDIDVEDWGNLLGFAHQKDYDEFRKKYKV
ncbi:FkbM family methyltransferase [Winogradskyella sp.]|uniref:FkbM family methyltransferase n=1 Tax=Winogradskyella sp. TaxID=1883156 RepID=UPI00351243AA